jgi:hypothetical protein
MQLKQFTILLSLFQLSCYHATKTGDPRPVTPTTIHSWTHGHFERSVAAQKSPSQPTLSTLKNLIHKEACRGITENRKTISPDVILTVKKQDPEGLLSCKLYMYKDLLKVWGTQ